MEGSQEELSGFDFFFLLLAPFLVEQNLLFVTLVCIVLDVECNVHARN